MIPYHVSPVYSVRPKTLLPNKTQQVARNYGDEDF